MRRDCVSAVLAARRKVVAIRRSHWRSGDTHETRLSDMCPSIAAASREALHEARGSRGRARPCLCHGDCGRRAARLARRRLPPHRRRLVYNRHAAARGGAREGRRAVYRPLHLDTSRGTGYPRGGAPLTAIHAQGPASTPWPSSVSPRRSGRRSPPPTAGMRPAPSSGARWPPQGTTRRSGTPGWTRSERPRR